MESAFLLLQDRQADRRFAIRFDPPFDFGGDPAEIRNSGYLQVIGRLRDGVELDAAQAEMALVTERLAQEYPDTNAGEGAAVTPLHEAVVGSARSPLLVLLGAGSFVASSSTLSSCAAMP